MFEPTDIKRDDVSERLFRIYADTNRDLLKSVQGIVAPNAAYLAEYFYTQLLAINESAPYLSHSVVSERLHRSMTEWIKSLFLPSDERSVAEHMKWQQAVGDVHARINVPMRLVNHGIRLLKAEISRLIAETDQENPQKYQEVILVNDLLDFSSSLINESYILHRIHNENDSQALKLHLMSLSLVVELERLRSSLFDWLRKTVSSVYEKFPEEKPVLASAYNTDFGLWVIYKAELLFSEQPELINKLRNQLNKIQSDIEKINSLTGKASRAALSQAIDGLNESITNATWMLSDFSSQAYELESGKDALTRLFNRRFLASVMQNMIRASKSANSSFSILCCDLDNFKHINDEYGHDAGDKTLIAFGNFLVSTVRATDYVFRMGGDEFLVILVGANIETSTKIAQKILEQLELFTVKIDEHHSIAVKTSIGIVEYDGHPDYTRILKDADHALYQAKELGKNTYYARP